MTDRENIVLVSVDSVRADHCGFVNPEVDLTPTMDELAGRGISFTDAVAPGPRTPSSMPAVFTGEFLPKRNIEYDDWRERRRNIAEQLRRGRPIPRRLQERGYHTVGFNTNPWTTRDTGFDVGFDEFHDFGKESSVREVSSSRVVCAVDRLLKWTDNEHLFNWHNKEYWFADWTQFFDRVVEDIRATRRPYFAWIFLTDTHLPYLVPGQHREEISGAEMYYAAVQQNRASSEDDLSDHVVTRLRQAYRDAIRSVDAFFAELQDALEATDPVLVVHSDHGEAFGEHGTFGHQRQLYQENLHVPLLIHGTGDESTVDDPVSLRSMPTLIERIADPNGHVDPQTVTDAFVSSTVELENHVAVKDHSWKMIAGSDGPELYDLDSDPGERTEVGAENPQVYDSLMEVLQLQREDRMERARIVGSSIEVGDESA